MFLLKKKIQAESNPAFSAEHNQGNDISGQLQVAVDQMNGVMEQMKVAAENLEETSQSSKGSTMELIEQMEETVENTLQVTDRMERIEQSAREISNTSSKILHNSESSFEDLNTSLASVTKLQERIEHLLTSHNTLLKQMEHLVEHSNKVNEIIYTIGSISQRTKILALNASIEAARAGDHGKGFSVVANEVGLLANQTSQAVEETRTSISLIHEEIEKSTSMVRNETEFVEDGMVSIGKIIETMDSFKQKLTGINDMVFHSTKAAAAQTENVQEITSFLQEISAMSVKNKDAALQVTADLTEQHESIDSILAISNVLAATSGELQMLVRKDDLTVSAVDQTLVAEVQRKLSQLLQNASLHITQTALHAQFLQPFLTGNDEIEAVWTNRTDGSFVYSNPPAGLLNAKARKWFIAAVSGEEYVSEVYISALTKRKCITISAPIFQNGQIAGVIGADISVK